MGIKPRITQTLRARRRIERNFGVAKAKIPYDVSERVVTNKDGSIDAEMRIRVPRGVTAQEVFTRVAQGVSPIPNTWVSTGIIFPPRDESEEYEKLRGMSIARTYSQRNTAVKLQQNLQGGEIIAERASQRGRRKPDFVLVRVHWNKEGERPDQPFQREKQKK